jgi:hypothetical protein
MIKAIKNQIRGYFIWHVIWWLEQQIITSEQEMHTARMNGFRHNESYYSGMKEAYKFAKAKLVAVVEGRDVLPRSNPMAERQQPV